MANPLAANPWPQVADFAKKVCTLALAVAEERKKKGFVGRRVFWKNSELERRIEKGKRGKMRKLANQQ